MFPQLAASFLGLFGFFMFTMHFNSHFKLTKFEIFYLQTLYHSKLMYMMRKMMMKRNTFQLLMEIGIDLIICMN